MMIHVLDPHLNLNGDLNKCRSIPVGCAQWTLTLIRTIISYCLWHLSILPPDFAGEING